MRRDLERRGILEAVRSDIARGKALRFLVDHAEVVDEAGNPLDLRLPEGEPAVSDQQTSEDEASEDQASKVQTEEPQA